ncbi:MAG: deoxyribonuclease IV [bacterium]|nr:deoxyribonuclease IV [bacterium]
MTKVGCHVSIAGGVDKAPERARELGCDVMQIFTRSPQGGKSPELTPEIIKEFRLKTADCRLQTAYIHTPYYINLASENNRIRYGSIKAIRDELERASALGAKYVMTHLGSAKELGNDTAIKKTVEGLKKVLDGYNGSAKLLIENSAGAGKIIGSDFEEIGKILNEVKSASGGNALAGICLDTQHSFASGYDWKNDYEKNMKILDKHIGLKNVKLIHANDSLMECGSRKDRHAHIGEGKIGVEAFKKFAAFAKKNNIDMIVETAAPGVVKDMEKLKEFISSR